MPDLSKITLPSGTEYNIKDAVARATVSGGLTFRGVTTTALFDESTITRYVVEGETLTAANGDLVIYNKKELVYSAADTCWHELGDNTSFRALAYADEASTDYTPSGTVSAPAFQGTQGNLEVTGIPEGSISMGVGNGDTNFTPEGTISKPNVSVTLDTETGYVANSATGGGTVTPGRAASCELPNLTFTVTGETLNIDWAAGSFTPNTPTAVQLPTFGQKTIATGVQSAGLDATPTFTGTPVDLEATFNGSQMTATGTFTPEGNVSQPVFTGIQETITVQ